MSVDTYKSHQLLGVVRSLENPPLALFRDLFFPNQLNSTSEQILFDIVDKKRRLAPYVSPLTAGKVLRHRGYETRAFVPPYVKPKSIIDPNEMFKRLAGEDIGGTLSPAQRRDARIAQLLIEHEEAITGLEEMQCSEALRLGQVTVTGEGYGTIVLSFGRHVDLTKSLTGTARWSQSAATPLTDLETWAELVRAHSGGAIIREWYMAPDAWSAFRARILANETMASLLFDSLRGSASQTELGPRDARKVKFMGRIGDFSFFTYVDTYQDASGSAVEVLPSGSVVGASVDVEGTRCYAAIRDVQNMEAVRWWPKLYADNDPSVEYLLSQSAPLMVPLRPNASIGVDVLNGGA